VSGRDRDRDTIKEETMRNRDKTIIAGAAAAFAVAGAGAAIAGTDALSPEDRSHAVIEDAAKELGVQPSELSDALKHGLENRIDEAVEAGRLTDEQGRALKERIESADVPLVLGGIGLGDRPGFGPGFGHVNHLAYIETASSYLGLDEDELRDALADGKSLAEIARGKGKPVEGLVNALVTDAEKRLDAAVDAGKLTEEQANEVKQNVRERVTDFVNREPGELRFGERRFGTGPGDFDPRAWPFPGEEQELHRPSA
jgi:polyhydroxyalkanoate synthesis regulator phasin